MLKNINYIFYRCGFKTEEPEVSRLEDSQSPPRLSQELEGLQSPPLDSCPPPTPPQTHWKTYSGKSRTTSVRMLAKIILTGSKSTATLCHRHRRPRLSTSSRHSASQSPQSPDSGMRSITGSSTLDQQSPDLFLVHLRSPSPGSLTPLSHPARTRPSGTSSLRAWLHLVLIRRCTEAAQEVEVTPLWTR